MPRTKSAALNLSALPLNPHYFYRKHSPVTKAVIGLQATQIDAMIEAGELPPPVPAYEGAKATGWVGQILIELQEKRLAQAKAEAERLAREHETAASAPDNETPPHVAGGAARAQHHRRASRWCPEESDAGNMRSARTKAHASRAANAGGARRRTDEH
jgi:hypothetical protein